MTFNTKVVLDHPEVADKLLKSNAKVHFKLLDSSSCKKWGASILIHLMFTIVDIIGESLFTTARSN